MNSCFLKKKSEKEPGKRGQIPCYSFATFSIKPSHVSSLSVKYPYPTFLLAYHFNISSFHERKGNSKINDSKL